MMKQEHRRAGDVAIREPVAGAASRGHLPAGVLPSGKRRCPPPGAVRARMSAPSKPADRHETLMRAAVAAGAAALRPPARRTTTAAARCQDHRNRRRLGPDALHRTPADGAGGYVAVTVLAQQMVSACVTGVHSNAPLLGGIVAEARDADYELGPSLGLRVSARRTCQRGLFDQAGTIQVARTMARTAGTPPSTGQSGSSCHRTCMLLGGIRRAVTLPCQAANVGTTMKYALIMYSPIATSAMPPATSNARR